MQESAHEPPTTAELEALLDERARVLSGPVRTAFESLQRITHVCFEAGSVRFAIDANAVIRIVRDPRTTRIPGAPIRLARVTYEGGRIVSVVDPAGLVGNPAAPECRRRVLIVEHGSRRIGLFADEVTSLGSGEDLEVVVPAADRERNPFVVGTTRSLTVVLDAAAIIDRAADGSDL